MAGEERRRSPRIAKQFIVRYRCPEIGQTQWLASPIKDLSTVGVRFFGEYGYKIGADLEMELSLPIETKPIPVKGRVVWQRRHSQSKMTELGAEFIDLDPPALQVVTQTVKTLFQKRSGS